MLEVHSEMIFGEMYSSGTRGCGPLMLAATSQRRWPKRRSIATGEQMATLFGVGPDSITSAPFGSRLPDPRAGRPAAQRITSRIAAFLARPAVRYS
jgi:hypothetical protein